MGICIGAFAAVIIIIVSFVMVGATVMGQTPDKFEAAFQNDPIVTNGIANTTYLNDSAYEVTSFKCSDIRKTTDYEVTANITATIENANYRTENQVIGRYYDASKTDSELLQAIGSIGYDFEVQSYATTPKKGIDYDAENELSNVNSTLADDAMSCTVTTNNTNSFWFADSTIDKTYTYTFDGTSWSFQGMQENDSITYKTDIEGDYAPKVNKEKVTKFTISTIDAEKGTFQIDYTMSRTNPISENTFTSSGTINASIEQQQDGFYVDYEQADGKTYYFQGTGNSDGGNGQSEMDGYLVTSNSGESSLQIMGFNADFTYTAAATIGGGWTEARTMSLNNVTLFKE